MEFCGLIENLLASQSNNYFFVFIENGPVWTALGPNFCNQYQIGVSDLDFSNNKTRFFKVGFFDPLTAISATLAARRVAFARGVQMTEFRSRRRWFLVVNGDGPGISRHGEKLGYSGGESVCHFAHLYCRLDESQPAGRDRIFAGRGSCAQGTAGRGRSERIAQNLNCNPSFRSR